MDANRKAAYRSILYHFLLHIKTLTIPLIDDQSAATTGRYAGPVAYQLHNLALASVNDFVDFSESNFWASIDAFSINNPDMTLTHIRMQFDADLLHFESN